MVINLSTFKVFEQNLIVPDFAPITSVTQTNGRFYNTPQGLTYPSVTTVLKDYNKPQLDKWKLRVGEAEAEKIKVQAGNRGTIIHTLVEKYLLGDTDYFCNSDIMPSHYETFCDIKHVVDNCLTKIIANEIALYSDYLQVGGRIDVVGMFEDRLAIIDFKTSRKPKRKEWITHYFMQAAAYAVMFEERFDIAVQKIVLIISVDNDITQIWVENRDDYIDQFIAQRKLYKDKYGQ